MKEPEGSGWLIFAGIMIGLGGVLSIIWGIAAIEHSSFFASNGHYLITSLRTWGWIVLIIGILELCASFSIFTGGQVGRWFGIAAAGAEHDLGAHLDVGGARSGRCASWPSTS